MDKRQQELKNLKEFNNNITKEVTLLLQNLQWDPKLITEKCPMVACKYDSNHRILSESRGAHEQRCQLTKLGYIKEDSFLPDPVDLQATTLVKFAKHEITEIINNAASIDPSFKRGCEGLEPLTVERLQGAYTADERRAIHDAVVSTAPFCHDLTDLELLGSNNGTAESQKKSRLEILAELRNMKRRRTKYRVAPKTRNYSDVLRDVIKTQMDSYGETTRTIIKTEYGPNCYVSQKVTNCTFEPHVMTIKQERESPETHNKYQRQESRENYRGRSNETRKTDEMHSSRKDDSYSNKERNKTYHARNETSKHSKVERNRDRRRDDDERWHKKDRYLSKERSRNYDDHRSHYGRSREKRNDERHLDYSRDSSKDYERVIKQERPSPESEPYASSSKDHNRDLSRSINDCSDSKYYGKERKEIHRMRHSPNKFEVHEKESLPSELSRDKETSRKRHRSRSREKRHKDKKKRHDKDKHSFRGKEQARDSRKGGPDYLFHTIKQERESP